MKNFLKSIWKGVIYEPFNYPYRKIIPNALYGTKSPPVQNFRFLIGFIPLLRNIFYVEEVSERIVEDPFVISEITKLPLKSKITDLECFSSILPLQLSSFGYKIDGVDLNTYKYTHPNFKFYNIDIFNNKFIKYSYDAIYAVSVIEHVGYGWYKNENIENNDARLLEHLETLLKKNGSLILTFPFGKKFKKLTDSRMYDKKALTKLFKNFNIKYQSYYTQTNSTTWTKTTINKLNKYNVCCVVLNKK